LLQKNAAEVLNQITELAEFSPDFSSVLEELISLLHRVAVVQAVPDSVNGDETLAQKLRNYASQITAEDLQLYYQIALIGRRDLPLNPSPKAGLEMVLLRMLAFSPVDSNQSEAPKKKLTTSPAENTQRPVSQSQSPAAPTQPTVTASRPVQSPNRGQGKAAQALAMARGEMRADSQPKTVGRAKLDLVVDNDIAGLAEIAAIPNKADSEPDYYADETSQSQPQAPSQPSRERKPDPSPSSVTQESAGTAPEQPAESAPSSEPVQRLPLADLNTNDDWIKVVFQTPLRGMTRNILMQCAFDSRVDTQINLKVDPQYIDLLNASHQSRIEQALIETLDAAIKVTVQAGSVEVETPAGWDQRVRSERLKAARESLENDENVQGWVAEFDAILDIDSIKPIDK